MKRNKKITTTTCEQHVHHTVTAGPFFKKKDKTDLKRFTDQGKHPKPRRGIASLYILYFSHFFASFFNFSIPLPTPYLRVNIFKEEPSLTG